MLRLNVVKTSAPFHHCAVIVLLCLGIARSVHGAGTVQDLLKRIREQLPRTELETGPQLVAFGDGIRVETAVFIETTWQLKDVPQSSSLSIRIEAEATDPMVQARLKSLISE